MTLARPASGRRAALTAALIIAIVAIPVALYLWGRTSDSFAVERVVVTGDERVPRREVERRLTTRYIGENLFSIGAGDVRDTLSDYPYIADVHVDRDFPSTLRVRLTEYTPAALLFGNGAWYVLSQEGRVLAQLDAIEADKSPRLTPTTTASGASGGSASAASGSTSGASDPGTSGEPTPHPSPSRVGPLPTPLRTIVPRGMRGLPLIATDQAPVAVGEDIQDERVIEGLDVLASLPDALRRNVAAVRVRETSAKVFMRDGLEVEFGSVDDLDVKVLALRAVVDRYHQRRIRPTFVDVSVPTRPLGAPVLPTTTPQ